ncbi:hypothetical protein [Mitsuaria sp. 7]|uniref:hypothetical protein n=1 Tax=Mitsuaria sp. 7 TaxID=1658665 RepID=UPI0012F83771|nr:hypothetical protein [Mitsuaria sp. 7]
MFSSLIFDAHSYQVAVDARDRNHSRVLKVEDDRPGRARAKDEGFGVLPLFRAIQPRAL